MILKLTDFVRHGRIADFDTESGRVQILSSSAHDATKGAPRTAGFVSRVAGRHIAVYACEGKLWLQYGSSRVDIESIQITWRRVGRFKNHFAVTDRNSIIWSVDYRSARSNLLNLLDPTFDTLDEELSDFPLWLSKVYSDPEWRVNSLRNWGGMTIAK